jgi:hypothetical protein
LQLIKKELEQHPSLFTFESASSSSKNSEPAESGLDITRYIEMVHSREYLSYLSNAYHNWVQSGGNLVPPPSPRQRTALSWASSLLFPLRTLCYPKPFRTRNCSLDRFRGRLAPSQL